MEKTSLKKQLSQLFVAATVGIVLITVLTKDAVTVHWVLPLDLEMYAPPYFLLVLPVASVISYLVFTKVSFTSYRVNHRKYAIPQTERNMELISHYKDSMLLALTGLTLYITIGFAGLFPFTPIGITFSLSGDAQQRYNLTPAYPFHVILQRGLEPVAHFCVTLQSLKAMFRP